VAGLVSTVFTDDDKKNLKVIAAELIELRKLIEELTESLVNVSDKKLMKMLNASQDDFKENKVLNYKEKLEKQIDIAEKEFRS
jgi:glutathionyl-hydroquinone reductase